jgi:hypothetical protein
MTRSADNFMPEDQRYRLRYIRQMLDPCGPGSDDDTLNDLETFMLQVIHYMGYTEETEPALAQDDLCKVTLWMERAAQNYKILQLVLTGQVRPFVQDDAVRFDWKPPEEQTWPS